MNWWFANRRLMPKSLAQVSKEFNYLQRNFVSLHCFLFAIIKSLLTFVSMGSRKSSSSSKCEKQFNSLNRKSQHLDHHVLFRQRGRDGNRTHVFRYLQSHYWTTIILLSSWFGVLQWLFEVCSFKGPWSKITLHLKFGSQFHKKLSLA